MHFCFFYYFASILLGQISQFTICTTCYESHTFFHSFVSLTRAPPSLIKLQIHEKSATFITSCTIYHFLLHQIYVKSCNILDHVSFLSCKNAVHIKTTTSFVVSLNSSRSFILNLRLALSHSD
jgi:hypothetical protein